MTGSAGFHEGELAVQARAGVGAEAARLSVMLASGDLSAGISKFLQACTSAVLSARDRDGRLWISPLAGAPGFLEGAGSTLRIRMTPLPGDPLYQLPGRQPVGLLAIDLATRRRLRVNGLLAVAGADTLEIAVDQAFGNCPQYIQRRLLKPTAGARAAAVPAHRSGGLTDGQAGLIQRADTFFLGTTHPERGKDASHRGGSPGFVRVAGGSLWWPDYPGNNMFNSLGNLAVDDAAALLFADFAAGTTLHLSGHATVEWIARGSAGDDGGTGRRVRFTVAEAAGAQLSAVSDSGVEPYPFNPPVRDSTPE